MSLRIPAYKILCQGKNITDGDDPRYSLAPLVTELTVTDKCDGEADELELCIDGAKATSPEILNIIAMLHKGAVLTPSLGYRDETVLKTFGTFAIDEVRTEGPPDTITFSGTAITFGKPLRETRCKVHSSTSLKQIAQDIARSQGLKLVGDIDALPFTYIHQREGDIGFLRTLADRYGYIIAIKAGQLIFTKQSSIDAQKASHHFVRSDLLRWNFRDKTFATHKRTTVKGHHPKDRQTLTVTKDAQAIIDSSNAQLSSVLSNDEMKEINHLGDSIHLITQVDAHNSDNEVRLEGTLTLEGNSAYAAAQIAAINGFGDYNGNWRINQVKHKINSSGYVCDLTVRRPNYGGR